MWQMTREQAISAVMEYLKRDGRYKTMDLVTLDEQSIETEQGWLIFWDSRLYLETGDVRFALAGNGPFIVDHAQGTVTEISSSVSLDEIMKIHKSKK